MRLISFLGTGNCGETTYSFESSTCRTRYEAHALASFTWPNEIHLIATAEAWNQHGNALAQGLSGSGLPLLSKYLSRPAANHSNSGSRSLRRPAFRTFNNNGRPLH